MFSRHKKGTESIKRVLQPFSLVLVLSILLFSISACSNIVPELLQYTNYGKDVSTLLAKNYPFRVAGSEGERVAADYIKQEFVKLGYKTEEQEVSLSSGATSQNIIVRIPGAGFVADPEIEEQLNFEIYDRRAKSEYGLFNRQVIVGARYDSNPNVSETGEGFSDNASGVGALLTLAKELKQYVMGYDIILVAFGGGYDNYAGAKTFAASMTAEEIKNTDAFYEFRSLFSGDKLYVHAGLSSLYPEQKYRLRQKSYELMEIASRENVYSLTGEAIYQNQSGISIENPLFGQEAPAGMGATSETFIYREVTTTESDYRAFDKLAIPCVFIESFNYDIRKNEGFNENRDPKFAANDFMVRGTEQDNTIELYDVFASKELKYRVNSSAFLVLKAIENGVLGAKVH